MRPEFHGFAVLLLVFALGLASVGNADANPEAAEMSTCDDEATTTEALLHTFVLYEHGVVVDLPVSHNLAGEDGLWYVFGYLDGEPLVPDVRISFLPGDTPDEAITVAFPGAVLSSANRRFATELFIVTTPTRLPDGTSVEVELYALPVQGGVIVAERYEGFDWGCFDLVGRSLRTYRRVE